jgi:hypothetical protein
VGAHVQADAENNGLNVNSTVGPISLQAMTTGTRDNLDGIESILTTRTRNRSVNSAVAIGSLLGASGWYWPNLTLSWQRMRQYGEAVPINSDFTPTHVPDQVSTSESANLSWSQGLWNLSYSLSRSFQDNRQTGRENSDFRAATHTVGLGVTPARSISVNVDFSADRQHNLEANTTQRMKRVGVRTQLQITRNTAVSGTSSHSWGFQPYGDQHTRNTDYNVELSQGVTFYGRRDRGSQGRIFIRYASRRASLTSSEAFLAPPNNDTWTLNAGASFRLY